MRYVKNQNMEQSLPAIEPKKIFFLQPLLRIVGLQNSINKIKSVSSLKIQPPVLRFLRPNSNWEFFLSELEYE